MSEESRFSGVFAPLLTPFDENGAPDAVRYGSHAKALLAEGCDGLVPFGTTGEANSLGMDERMALLDALIGAAIDPTLLLPGTGLCAVPDTVTLTRHAVQSGCKGVLLLPPFYYKDISDDGLFAHVAQVIERVGDGRLKIYLYHIKPIARVGYPVDLVMRLVEAYPGTIVGLKDSSGDWSYTQTLIEALPEFRVFSGSERFLLANLQAGGAGCITATGNINARAIVALKDNWNTPPAEALQENVTAFRKTMEDQGSVIPFMKAFIAHTQSDPSWCAVRPPLTPMDIARIAGNPAVENLRSSSAA